MSTGIIIAILNHFSHSYDNAFVGYITVTSEAQGTFVSSQAYVDVTGGNGIVPIPDKRLDKLFEMFKPPKKTAAFIKFVDIAGIVKGASQGEGLGNKFLANIREVDAIIHVVRLFEDENREPVKTPSHPPPIWLSWKAATAKTHYHLPLQRNSLLWDLQFVMILRLPP